MTSVLFVFLQFHAVTSDVPPPGADTRPTLARSLSREVWDHSWSQFPVPDQDSSSITKESLVPLGNLRFTLWKQVPQLEVEDLLGSFVLFREFGRDFSLTFYEF